MSRCSVSLVYLMVCVQTAIPAQRVPVQLTAPNRGGEQKPRIIRVMADGQEQEYIITTDPTTTAATATTAEAPGLQVGEEVLPYTTLTTEQATSVLPQVRVCVCVCVCVCACARMRMSVILCACVCVFN